MQAVEDTGPKVGPEDEPKEETAKSAGERTTKPARFVESTLTLTFWLCASLLIMQPARLYFTHEITQFFNFEGTIDHEGLFIPFAYAYSSTLLISIFLARILRHVHVLSLAFGILCLLPLIVLFSLLPAFINALLFGIGLGLIPASAVCSVVETLSISPSIRQRHKNLNSAESTRIRPVGMYIFIPVLATLVIIFKSLVGLLLILCLLCICILVLLLTSRHFGTFTSTPRLTQSLAGTFANGMFYFVIAMLVLVSLIDVFVLYHVPHVIHAYAPKDGKNITAFVLLIILMMRIAMIIFAELALIRVAPRRMLVLSACAIILAVLTFALTHESEAQLIVLFVLSSSLSVAFPSLIKSMAKFTPFSVLPLSIVSMALVGNIVTFFSTTYFFSYALQTKNVVFFYALFALLFLVLTVLFFIISRRKKSVLEHGA